MAQQPQPNLQNLAQALIMVSNEVGNISNMPVIQINQQMNAITGMLQQQQQTLQQMQQMQQQMQQQQQQMQQQQQQMQQQMQQMQQQMQQLLQRLSVGEKRQIARVFNSSSQINVDPLPNDADILPDATFPTTRSVFSL